MIKATFTPRTPETKILWCGLYGGHYDIIVFFKEKPTPSFEKHNCVDGQWYDCGENTDLIVGDMVLGVFYDHFPDADLSPYTQKDGRPLDIEIPEVFQMEVTTFFDEDGYMESIKFHEDW